MRALRQLGFLLALSAHAFPAAAQAGQVAAGIRFGTLGVGAEGAVGLTSRLALRTGVNYFSLNRDEGIQGISYALTLRPLSIPLLLDVHPSRGSFRFSAGLIFNQNEATGDGVLNQGTFIGNNEYSSAQVQSLTGKVGFRSASPFLGLGFDNALSGSGPVSFSFELGVMFHGHPKATLSGVTTLIGAAREQFDRDMQAELREIQDEVDDLPGVVDYFPVIGFGLKYRL